MRQIIIILSLFGSLIVFLASIDFFESFLMFILFGMLPGKNSSLSANQMLTIHTVAFGVITAYGLRGILVRRAHQVHSMLRSRLA